MIGLFITKHIRKQRNRRFLIIGSIIYKNQHLLLTEPKYKIKSTLFGTIKSRFEFRVICDKVHRNMTTGGFYIPYLICYFLQLNQFLKVFVLHKNNSHPLTRESGLF